MSSSRGFGVGETSEARASSSSVVLPMAETVPTTFNPRRFASTNRRATWRILSGSATEEPPNFITTVSNSGVCTGEVSLLDEARAAVGLQRGRHRDARSKRRVGNRVERRHDEGQVTGPHIELGV